MATSRFHLGTRRSGGRECARGAIGLVEHICCEDSNKRGLAGKQRVRQPVALRGRARLKRRHGDGKNMRVSVGGGCAHGAFVLFLSKVVML